VTVKYSTSQKKSSITLVVEQEERSHKERCRRRVRECFLFLRELLHLSSLVTLAGFVNMAFVVPLVASSRGSLVLLGS